MENVIKIINRALNINTGEWNRIIISWLIRVAFYAGKVMGWTVILAVFSEKIGIANLPFLFVLAYGFAFISGLALSKYVEKITPANISVYTSIGIIICIIIAYVFYGINIDIFLLLLIFANTGLIPQLSVFISNYSSIIFSPLESERVYPIIESGKNIGGVIGGGITIILLKFVETYALIWAWLISLLILIAIILIYEKQRKTSLPHLNIKKEKTKTQVMNFQKWKLFLNQYQFLRLMAIAVFLQFCSYILIDYQYSYAIAQKAMEGENAEQEIAKILGLLNILFSSGGFIIQLFFAGRILKKLGAIKNYLLNPLTGLTFVGGMTLFPNFILIILSRFQSDIHNELLSKNSIYSACYSFPFHLRNYAKELFEGVMKPLGRFIGSILVIIIMYIGRIIEFNQFITINILILIILGSLLFLTLKLKKPYTEISTSILINHNESPDQYDAAEILTQPGHIQPEYSLMHCLRSTHSSNELKIKILKSLGNIKKHSTIPNILGIVENPNTPIKVQIAAVKAVGNFKKIGEHFENQIFARYYIIKTLKKLLQRKKIPIELRRNIVRVFSRIHEPEIVPIMLNMLKDKSPEIRSDIAYIMGFFHDISIERFLNDYLNDPHPRVRTSVIISLWQFENKRISLIPKIIELLESKDLHDNKDGIFVIGEIQAHFEVQYLINRLKHKNPRIRMHCAFALSKLGYEKYISNILDFVLCKNQEIAKEALNLLNNLPESAFLIYKKLLRKKISALISSIIKESGCQYIDELNKKELRQLNGYYLMINEEAEAMRIKNILTGKRSKI